MGRTKSLVPNEEFYNDPNMQSLARSFDLDFSQEQQEFNNLKLDTMLLSKGDKGSSKVDSVQGAGTWENERGVDLGNGKKGFFKFEYSLSDGAVFVANHKTSDPKFSPGSDVDYEITYVNHEHGIVNGKVSKPQEKSTTSNQNNSIGGESLSIEVRSCMNTAFNIHSVAGFKDSENPARELCETAEYLFTELKRIKYL